MTKCSITECVIPQKVKGMCKKHYTASWHKTHPEASAAWHKANPKATADWHKANSVMAWHKANPKAYANWRKTNSGKLNANAQRAYATKIQRIPIWANHDKINEWYQAAAFATEVFGVPCEVDHIIPLHGKFVSGLHVDYNMQILTTKENQHKRNKFEVI